MGGRPVGSKNTIENTTWDNILFNVVGLDEFKIDNNKEYIEYVCSPDEKIRFNKDLTSTFIIGNRAFSMQKLSNYYVLYRYINKLLSDEHDFIINTHLSFIEI